MPHQIQIVGLRPRPDAAYAVARDRELRAARVDRRTEVECRSAGHTCPSCDHPTTSPGKCSYCRRWTAVELRSRKLGVAVPVGNHIDVAEKMLDLITGNGHVEH